MSKREKHKGGTARERLQMPVSPSVWGTAKQADRAEKGGRVGSGHRREGRGHPPGKGRGGKVRGS